MLAKANQEVKRLGLKVFLLIVISCMFTYFSLYTFETVTFKDSKILQLDNHISLLFNDEKTGDSNKKEKSIKTGDDVDPIRLVSVSNIYIDPKKSFVFYEESQQIAWTSLIVADQKSQIPSNKINVLIKQGDRTVFNSNVDPFQRQIYSNKHYTSYVASFRLENANLTGDKNDKTPMRYQIIVDGKPSEEYPVLFVRKDHMTMKSTRTARLIKCIWMPSNVKTFEYIIQLIIDCKYDSIYVCVFRKDEELKKILTQFDSKQKIKIIELENLPNAVKKGTEINHFFEVFEDRVDSEMFDPALEFLLNMVYPLLVNKYRYVHAADYDHIVFSHNLTMYERIQQVIKVNNAPQDASLYFNQYWALDNLKSQEIFQNVQNYLNQISVTDLEKSDGKITYPVDIKTKSFDLRLNEKKDFIYAIKILKLLNENKDSMYRYVTFKFQHMYIYGQTIHNTKSSLLIKLCEAGMYFTNGQSVTVSSPHSIHYREDYNFNLLKVEDRYLPMSSFVLSNDFEKRK